MENTLLVALSKQMALRNELDVVANNMANVNTRGFRRDAMTFQEYLMPVASADGFPAPDKKLSYVEDLSTFHDFTKGPLEQTGNPLDVSLADGAFFAVQTPGGTGERYTRNGAFQIDKDGRLVTGDGLPVLGESGPIVLDPQNPEITIAEDGTVSNKDGTRGRLKIVSFADPQKLTKEGASLFVAPADQAPQTLGRDAVRVMQGVVEGSNVRPVLEMSRMIEINRAYSSLAAMVQHNDDLRKTAIERLAEIPS
jgi:flagellar basal-body rod protein FlgF